MDNVSLFAAFAAGLLSFVSPCVLPLIPGYLSFVSGATIEEMRGAGVTSRSAALVSGARRKTLLASLAFVSQPERGHSCRRERESRYNQAESTWTRIGLA